MAKTTNEKVNTHLSAALESLEREKAQIDAQIKAIRSVLGQATPAGPSKSVEAPAAEAPVKRRKKRRKLSAEARARIAAAQKKRWSEYRKKENG